MREIRLAGEENPEEANVFLGKYGSAHKYREDDFIREKPSVIAAWHIVLDGDAPDEKRHYGLSIVHLRDVSGLVKAKKFTPNASHEILLAPLEGDISSDPIDLNAWIALDPVAQSHIENLSDEQAASLASLIAFGCLEGLLPVPKPGEWIKWGPHINDLFQHYRNQAPPKA